MGGKKRAQPAATDAATAAYDRLLATAGVERKGKKMPYTSLNGHMYSFLAPDGLVSLRLPEAKRAEFIERFETRLSVQYDTVMKEYALVPAAVLERTEIVAPYFAASIAYVKSLKPKPTRR